ncbi:3-oxoadipate enol-lactonase [Lentzea albidocapillata subsp. violacea]|uniref:3-oxoadipate enol-lactonase n=1 Tax=Lentzea albidocapillata subsp. violacea TaxID=128104 RepID=A0A1G8PEE8_9PSEU|nr:alpha/beta fold hydrolase [Lentzea albidocapillata]SDI90883.1 3-oxoadipate enol-lactonase [Lentzea albidocapillata subsp. violacea]
MTTELSLTRLAGAEGSGQLLVVGPSLGTSVSLLWRDCAAALGDGFEVIGWDLPGHGNGAPAEEAFTVPRIADELTERAGALAGGRACAYAGVSFGGAVGFELAARGEGPFEAVVGIGAARRIGEPEMWRARAALVRRAGTSVMVDGSARRWFAPGFVERVPRVAGGLLTALAGTDNESYALACEALAVFEAGGAVRPLRVVVGEHDVVVSPDGADVVLAGCGHLPPAEDPVAVARTLIELLREMRCPTTTA